MSKRDRGERAKRDAALKRVKNNPNNNFDQILDGIRRHLRNDIPYGKRGLISREMFRLLMEKSPNIQPQEKRVMGQVMVSLRREKLVAPVGVVAQGSHKGLVTAWKRTYVP